MTNNRARMGDVAALSGLSRSTVDRVLNGRAGVRAETVARVEAAMRSLGYAPSSLSARKVVAHKNVALVLPEGTNPFFDVVIRSAGQISGLDAFVGHTFHSHRYDTYAPDSVIPVLQSLPPETDALVIVGVDNDDVTDALSGLSARGVRVITIISDAPRAQRFAYVGQDNFATGCTAARLLATMIPQGAGEVALLLGHLQFRHLLDRMSGFRQTLGLSRPDLTVIQPAAYGSDPAMTGQVVAELAARGDALRGVYLAGGGQPSLIDAFADGCPAPLKIIGHEITPYTRKALNEGRFQAVLAHDMDRVMQQALEVALDLRSPEDVHCAINIFVRDNLPD